MLKSVEDTIANPAVDHPVRDMDRVKVSEIKFLLAKKKNSSSKNEEKVEISSKHAKETTIFSQNTANIHCSVSSHLNTYQGNYSLFITWDNPVVAQWLNIYHSTSHRDWTLVVLVRDLSTVCMGTWEINKAKKKGISLTAEPNWSNFKVL